MPGPANVAAGSQDLADGRGAHAGWMISCARSPFFIVFTAVGSALHTWLSTPALNLSPSPEEDATTVSLPLTRSSKRTAAAGRQRARSEMQARRACRQAPCDQAGQPVQPPTCTCMRSML